MPPDDRLDSWKAISAYLKRDVTTVQRWEKREGMPVHRHIHEKLGSVYAFRSELDSWMRQRTPTGSTEPSASPLPEAVQVPAPTPRRWVAGLAIGLALILIGAAIFSWRAWQTPPVAANPLGGAHFQMVTDFEGTEQAAAVSRDGRLVAFTSDRDGTIDLWISQLGTGEFHNLTRGGVQQLVNPSVRTLGFSPDGSSVTFWARGVAGAKGSEIGIWSVPALGGEPRPYLEGAAEFDWSRDGSRIVFHTPGPGDPTFVAESSQQAPRRKIFEAAAGLHAHFPTWSPGGDYIYFVQGMVPDAMDLWRMNPNGEGVERMTQHNAMVSHPVFLDDTTLLYLASGADGAAQRIYSLDLRDRMSQVLGTGLDRYTSLSASSDGRRIVATRSNPKASLWRLPIGDAPAAPTAMKVVSMPTGRGFAPRLGPGFLLYVSQKGSGDAIWKVSDAGPAELWSASDARVFGGPEISSDGSRVAFSVEQRGRTLLYVMNSDGTDVRVASDTLQLRGSPAWAPDGQSIASGGSSVNGTAQLFRIPFDGAAVPIASDFAIDPVWSPAGDFIVYSAADVGTQFPLKAVAPDGASYPAPSITLTRGARRLRFSQGGRALLMMRGDIRHKDLWLVDLETGKDRQLTQLPPDFNIRDFDISPDGKEIMVERVQDHSDIVVIERPARAR